MKNVKLPLTYSEGSDREWYIHDADGNWIAEAVPADPGVAEEVARHIVACVNACAGISTENLEDNLPLKELAHRYNKTLKQRDKLLTALKRLLFASQTTGGTAGRDDGLCAAIADAEAAIASAKGGAA